MQHLFTIKTKLKLLKSVKISQSYSQIKVGLVFLCFTVHIFNCWRRGRRRQSKSCLSVCRNIYSKFNADWKLYL